MKFICGSRALVLHWDPPIRLLLQLMPSLSDRNPESIGVNDHLLETLHTGPTNGIDTDGKIV